MCLHDLRIGYIYPPNNISPESGERERERHRNAGTRPESYFSVPIIQYCTRLGTVNFPPHLGLSGWCISCGGANLIGRDSQDNFSGDTADN